MTISSIFRSAHIAIEQPEPRKRTSTEIIQQIETRCGLPSLISAFPNVDRENFIEVQQELSLKAPRLAQAISMLDLMLQINMENEIQLAGHTALLNSEDYNPIAPGMIFTSLGVGTEHTNHFSGIFRLTLHMLLTCLEDGSINPSEVFDLSYADKPDLSATSLRSIQSAFGKCTTPFGSGKGALASHTFSRDSMQKTQELMDLVVQSIAFEKEEVAFKSTLFKETLQAILLQSPELSEFCNQVIWACKPSHPKADGSQRFPIVEDTADLIEHSKSVQNSNLGTPTFLEGIQRPYDLTQHSSSIQTKPQYIIIDQGITRGVLTQASVLVEVFTKASLHLNHQSINDFPQDEKPYPLGIYLSLARCLNKQVPQFLKTYEQGVVNQANEIKEHKLKKIEAQRKAIKERDIKRANDIEALDSKIIAKFGPGAQLIECYGLVANRPHTSISTKSIDSQFTLTADQHGLIVSVDEYLAENHTRLNIAYQNFDRARVSQFGHRRRDNKCWLRAGYLSLFHQFEESKSLQQAIRQCGAGQSEQVRSEYAKLGFIFEQVHQNFLTDPPRFMFGNDPINTELEAHLSSGNIVSELFHQQEKLREFRSIYPQSMDLNKDFETQTATELMHQLAAGFIDEQPRINYEIHALVTDYFQRRLASSDFPIYLHRALGKPVMVIEKHTQGHRGIRIAAPKGTTVANTLKKFEDKGISEISGDNSNAVLKPLLTQFRGLPIIYLRQEHFELFLPKYKPQTIDTALAVCVSNTTGQLEDLETSSPDSHKPQLEINTSYKRKPEATVSLSTGKRPRSELLTQGSVIETRFQPLDPSPNSSTKSSTNSDSYLLSGYRSSWDGLNTATKSLALQAYVPSSQVHSNLRGVPCPLATCLKTVVNGQEKPLHANTVSYTTDAKNQSIVGQSPKGKDYITRTLSACLQNPETNRDIFEFVKPRNAINEILEGFNKAPLAIQLIRQLEHAKNNNAPCRLGEMELINIQQLPSDDLRLYQRYKIDLIDGQGQKRVINITQASFSFYRSLSAEQITQAQALLNRYHGNAQADKVMLLSEGGIGRSAMLSVYNHIENRISEGDFESENALKLAIDEAILQGRKDRGENFISNQKQYDELVKALVRRWESSFKID